MAFSEGIGVTMEHRIGRRVQRIVPIELWQGGECLSHCKSQDIGLGGLGLTNVDEDFREGALLVVKIYSQAKSTNLHTVGTAPQFIRKAMVVNCGQNRLSLMWVDVNSDFVGSLTEASPDAIAA